LTLALSLLLSGITALAQGVVSDDEASPLLEMLARVPNTTEARTGEIYFLDREAIVAAFPPAEIPPDYVTWDDDGGETVTWDIYWRVYRNVSSGLQEIQAAFGRADTMPEVIGIDVFQIRQELAFGQPPANGAIISGEFDMGAVRTAFANNDFEQADSDVELWCWVEGCDMGTQTDLQAADPVNIFGGRLGRRQPLVIDEDTGTLFSAAGLPLVESYIATQTDTLPNLMDDERYIAITDVLAQQGIMIQAWIIDGERLLDFTIFDPISMLGLNPSMPREQLDQALDELINLDEFVALPPFTLLAFADIVREETQDGVVALVYSTEEEARTAADVIPARLETNSSLVQQRPWGEILEDRQLTVSSTVVEASNGRWVTLINFVTGRVPGDQVIAETEVALTDESDPDLIAPGLSFRLLPQAYQQRDMGWLNTASRADMEAILED